MGSGRKKYQKYKENCLEDVVLAKTRVIFFYKNEILKYRVYFYWGWIPLLIVNTLGKKTGKLINNYFLWVLIQLNWLKFAFNLFRRRQFRVWSRILAISISSDLKLRSKISKNGKNDLDRFFFSHIKTVRMI